MLVVDEITLSDVGLEDNFQSIARGCDINEQYAQCSKIKCFPLSELFLRILHVIHVHYYESRQAGGRLLAPAAHLAVLG